MNEKTVTSRDNRYVKQWRALCRDARARRESGLFAIEGARLCGDALQSGCRPEVLLYTAAAREAYAAVGRWCAPGKPWRWWARPATPPVRICISR